MVSQEPAKLSYLLWVVWVRVPVSPPYAVCPGGEGAVLKTVGCNRLAGSNPVHGARGQGESPKRILNLSNKKAEKRSLRLLPSNR